MDPTNTMHEIAKALFNNPLFTVTMFTATGDGTGKPRIRAAMGPAGTATLTIYHDRDLGPDKPFMFLVEMGDLEARQTARYSEADFPLNVIRAVLYQLHAKAFDTLTKTGAMIDSIDASNVTPKADDAQPDPEPCMEAPTLDQSEGEAEQAPTTPDQSAVSQTQPLFDFEVAPNPPAPGWRWLPHVQHLEYRGSRIRTVLDGMALDPGKVWSPMDVAWEMDMTQDQASHALSDLYKHGLVMRRKVGRIHHYKYRCLVTTNEPVTDTPSTAT